MKEYKKVFSLLLKQTWTRLDIVELQGLLRLMSSGFSFVDSLEIVIDDKQGGILKEVQIALSCGFSVESFLAKYLPKVVQPHFKALTQFMTFGSALELSLKMVKYDQQTRKKLVTSLLIPALLLIGSIIGIQLFAIYCFPMLLNLMQSFDVDTQYLSLLGNVITIAAYALLIILVLLCGTIIYFKQSKRIVLGYILLTHTPFGKIFTHFISGQFAFYFNECSKLGNKTQATLIMIQKIKKKPLLVFLAFHIEQALISGERMEDAISHRYMDHSLRKFIQIAIYSSSLNDMLDSYIVQNQLKGAMMCKRIIRRLTTISYGVVGLLIILIYQVLLLPLTILGQV